MASKIKEEEVESGFMQAYREVEKVGSIGAHTVA
jgi:hypothetical protein